MATDAAKDICASLATKAARNLLMDLGHADVVFALIIGERNTDIDHEP